MQFQFDASKIKPFEELEAIPAGVYNCRVVASEGKPTKSNDGYYLELTLEVIDGAYAGRKLFDRINLQNANPVAAEIGQRKLSAYCHATGVIQFQATEQLHGIPLKAKVKVRTDKTGQYSDQNDIALVKGINESFGGSAQTATMPIPPTAGVPQGPPIPPQPPSGAPPWGASPPQGFGSAAAPPGYVPHPPMVAGQGAPPMNFTQPGFMPPAPPPQAPQSPPWGAPPQAPQSPPQGSGQSPPWAR